MDASAAATCSESAREDAEDCISDGCESGAGAVLVAAGVSGACAEPRVAVEAHRSRNRAERNTNYLEYQFKGTVRIGGELTVGRAGWTEGIASESWGRAEVTIPAREGERIVG